MSNTVLKTFRLPEDIVREIEQESKAQNLSQTQYVIQVVLKNRSSKMQEKFEEELDRMAKDEAYQAEQKELAEANFD